MTCDRKPSTFVPANEQRVALLYDSVFYEIIFAFGISPHDPTDYCAWEHINFSRMGHARALYDFFETPATKRKQDDAVSEDFGFPARPIDRQAASLRLPPARPVCPPGRPDLPPDVSCV